MQAPSSLSKNQILRASEERCFPSAEKMQPALPLRRPEKSEQSLSENSSQGVSFLGLKQTPNMRENSPRGKRATRVGTAQRDGRPGAGFRLQRPRPSRAARCCGPGGAGRVPRPEGSAGQPLLSASACLGGCPPRQSRRGPGDTDLAAGAPSESRGKRGGGGPSRPVLTGLGR